jgi:hypothetical protein
MLGEYPSGEDYKKLPAGNKDQPSNQVARGQLVSLLKMKIPPLSWA